MTVEAGVSGPATVKQASEVQKVLPIGKVTVPRLGE
jgi:hypothetical protein